MPDPIDLHFWPTPNGWKITIMLEECGLPYRIVPVDISKGEQFAEPFLKLSPNGRMPAIVDPDGPGGAPISIFETGAILQFLGDKAGKFYPVERRARSNVEQWLFWQCAGLGPMAGQAAHFHYQKEKIQYAIDRYVNESRRLYGVINMRLKESEYLADDYSIADMATWPWIRGYKALGIDLAEFEHVQRWFKQVGARDAVRKGSSIGKEVFAQRQQEMRAPKNRENAEISSMAGKYRIFGSEMSPYSVKVRSYFRYKAIPHEWIPRGPAMDEEYNKYARLPIVPTVVTPEGQGVQDSTPIIEQVEAKHAERSIHPTDPDLKFLSQLFEEFGDEWGNKLMFHHRWWSEVDKNASAQTLARLNQPHGSQEDVAALSKTIMERMSGRGGFVGSNAATAPLITEYYFELLDLLQPHFAERKYLFGARPAFGDFGLFAQLYEASVDPTCGSIIRARGPNVLDWCFRMIEPGNDGEFESWNTLKPTLAPVLAYIGKYFLPWSMANAVALAAGEQEFSVGLNGKTYTQPPQKYHAKSLQAIRAAFKAVPDKSRLDAILGEADCLRYLS